MAIALDALGSSYAHGPTHLPTPSPFTLPLSSTFYPDEDDGPVKALVDELQIRDHIQVGPSASEDEEMSDDDEQPGKADMDIVDEEPEEGEIEREHHEGTGRQVDEDAEAVESQLKVNKRAGRNWQAFPYVGPILYACQLF